MNQEHHTGGLFRSVLSVSVPILAGLSAAQAWASIHVFLSNRELAGMLHVLDRAGYFIIPNRLVLPLLADFRTAFMGGLFFTFTVGLFLTIIAAAIGRMHHGSGKGLHSGAGRLALFILFSLLWINMEGFNPLASVYFIVVPPPVFFLSAMFHKRPETPPSKWIMAGHLAVLLILGGVGMARITANSFVDFRDQILLQNRLGQSVVDFYYAYTLYPAQAFKSPGQKTMNACCLSIPPESGEFHRLNRLLVKKGYFPVDPHPEIDLKIHLKNDQLVFQRRSNEILTIPLDAFYKDPSAVLDDFSFRTDNNRNFRQLTFISILIVLAAIPYFLVYSTAQKLLKRGLKSNNQASAAALAVCLAGGIIVLFWCFEGNRHSVSNSSGPAAETAKNAPANPEIDLQKTQSGMASGDTAERSRILETVLRQKLDITQFKGYRNIIESPVLYHRYLLTKALAFSRSRPVRNDIRILLEDSNMFVVYNAFDTLGRLGYRDMIPYVQNRIRSSNQWYVQLYAYRALKRLGWRQPAIQRR